MKFLHGWLGWIWNCIPTSHGSPFSPTSPTGPLGENGDPWEVGLQFHIHPRHPGKNYPFPYFRIVNKNGLLEKLFFLRHTTNHLWEFPELMTVFWSSLVPIWHNDMVHTILHIIPTAAAWHKPDLNDFYYTYEIYSICILFSKWQQKSIWHII